VVTGGAGFIGSALVKQLLSKNYHVTVVDPLSRTSIQNLESFNTLENFKLVKLDLLDEIKLAEVVKDSDLIFHLAANVDVRKGNLNPEFDFQNNIVATRNVLESMRKSNTCKKIIFTSSSVVYGEPHIIPTPEDCGPLTPLSIYGASKLACEALICGYVGTFGFESVIFRLANVIGASSEHGVIFDFFTKLKQSNGKFLEILGDGNQNKSYLYIDDCVKALTAGLDHYASKLEIFNVGADDQVDVNSIAQIIIHELGVNPEIIYSSELDGRGWIGDIKNMLLSTEKLKKTGWKIHYSSKDAIIHTVKSIIENRSNKWISKVRSRSE